MSINKFIKLIRFIKSNVNTLGGYSVRLGQILAVDHYIDCGYEDTRPNELVFQQLATMDFEQAKVAPSGNYEFDDEDDVCNRMRTMASDVHFAIESFSDNAMKGLKLAMLAGEHFFDYEPLIYRN